MAKIRRKDIYAEQIPTLPDDYVIGTEGKTGKTKNFSIRAIGYAIAELLGLTSFGTRLISIEDVTKFNFDIMIINAVWKINYIEYSVEEQALVIEPASEGYYRTDYIIGDANGDISIIQGQEDPHNASNPILPPNTVIILTVNIFGIEVQLEQPPLSDYMLKSNEGWANFKGQGDIYNLIWGSKNGIRWISTGDDVIIHSLGQMPDFMYDGRVFYIGNQHFTDKNLIIKHQSEDAAGNSVFYIPNGQDLTIGKGYTATFKYSSITSSTGRLDLVGISATGGGGNTTYFIPYKTLLVFKRNLNGNPAVLQGGDIAFGIMDDNDTFIPGGAYLGGNPGDPNNFFANPQDFSGAPPTNTP